MSIFRAPAGTFKTISFFSLTFGDALMSTWISLSNRLCRSLAFTAVALAVLSATPAFAQKVKLTTTAGDIIIELDAAKAPKSVENFVGYVKAGHYDGTVFHRVIPNFMIQGGGMLPDMKEKATRAPIVLESMNGLANAKGTVAMARTGVPNSATAQFFINVKDNDFLNGTREGTGYAVFGKVTSGMDVVEKIRGVRTDSRGPFENVPVEPIIIKQATLEK
jgi:peptidyl-prolyl cis-trans isomerase A (cyclophilin A)